jgi:two-component system, chemotaxis family, sensor kinase CheA
MDKDDLVKRLMVTFVGELEDHVRALERDLLALEKKPAVDAKGELFASLFRTAHTLKGSARTVRVDLLETTGHHLEEVFAAARDGRLPVDAAFFELLLATVDAIGEAGRRLRGNGHLAGGLLDGVIRRLAMAMGPREETAPAAPVEAAVLAHPATQEWSGVVRVPAEKLDALLAQTGEMLMVRHRAEARGNAAAALQELMATWHREQRRLEQSAAQLLKYDIDPEAPSKARDGIAQHRRLEAAIRNNREVLSRFEANLERLVADLAEDRRVIEQTATPLDMEVRRTRMMPFSAACDGLERLVRDLTARGDRKVRLDIEGGKIELDRSIVEGLKDPLLHLVRNAVDHGIEPAAARRAAGKPDSGRVMVAVAVRGPRVEVTVGDDGQGLDTRAIRHQLGKRAMAVPADDLDAAQAIFLPGLSTSETITPISGRGVGLDVVKTRLTSMRGTVDVAFEPGQGTKFTLVMPLTLTSVRIILVEASGQVYAMDTVSVHRVFRIVADDIRSIEGRNILLIAGVPVPLVPLTQSLGFRGSAALLDGAKLPVVVLAAGNRLAAFLVDGLGSEREVVVRALGPRLRSVKYVSGGTILPDGRVALILNAADLIRHALSLPAAAGLPAAQAIAPRAARKRLLVADDSVTVRTLQKNILESAGYDVMAAVDGMEAWHLLSENGADLVVSDVEMPRMDGFSLTEAIRDSRRFRDLPVILVTAMESDTDKTRGLAAGADAYCLKSAFDQKNLLATIARLL